MVTLANRGCLVENARNVTAMETLMLLQLESATVSLENVSTAFTRPLGFIVIIARKVTLGMP